jgi:fluoride exporter
MGKVVVLSIGGVLGTLARYFLANGVYRCCGTSFPYGTLAVNAIGCFLIGLFGTLAENKLSFGPGMRLLLMVGFCGAFTTFSTYIFETNGLMQDGEMLKAALNVTVSILAGFLVFKLGAVLGQLL